MSSGGPSDLHVTIAICTRNRAALLRDTLNSLLEMNIDEDCSFDVLVVDNNSTDDTRKVVETFLSRLRGRLTYHVERNIGLSFARNTAISIARGNVIAFTDDDIFFDPNWLRSVLRCFAKYPSADCIAGRVVPIYGAGRPEWLGTEPHWLFIEGLYGATPFGDSERALTRDDYLVGANMAFRKRMFEQLKPFSTSMGRRGKSLLSKEETELYLRMNKAGVLSVYCPGAQVLHRISNDRTSKKWILRRFYWQGVSAVVLANADSRQSAASLLKDIAQEFVGLWRVLLGGSVSPRSIYWHVANLRFWHAVFAAQSLGMLHAQLKYLVYPKSRPVY